MKGNIEQAAVITTVVSVSTAVGAGVGAALRGGAVLESAALVGAGTAVSSFYQGFFASPVPKSTDNLFAKAMGEVALLELVGTAIGYAGAKLFLKAATSSDIFLDAAIGFPVTVGVIVCLAFLFGPGNPGSTYDARPKRS